MNDKQILAEATRKLSKKERKAFYDKLRGELIPPPRVEVKPCRAAKREMERRKSDED